MNFMKKYPFILVSFIFIFFTFCRKPAGNGVLGSNTSQNGRPISIELAKEVANVYQINFDNRAAKLKAPIAVSNNTQSSQLPFNPSGFDFSKKTIENSFYYKYNNFFNMKMFYSFNQVKIGF